MRRQHTGRDGSVVIGPDWATAARATAAKTHTGACSIRHAGGTRGPIDTSTGNRGVVENTAHYTGPCSVTPETATAPEAGGETIPTEGYVVALDWGTAAATVVGDLVTITAAGPNGDATLTGVELVVDSIGHDTLAVERILHCSENQS